MAGMCLRAKRTSDVKSLASKSKCQTCLRGLDSKIPSSDVLCKAFVALQHVLDSMICSSARQEREQRSLDSCFRSIRQVPCFSSFNLVPSMPIAGNTSFFKFQTGSVDADSRKYRFFQASNCFLHFQASFKLV